MSYASGKPHIPGIHTIAEHVHIPDEPEPRNRRIYEAAKMPFALILEVARWVGTQVLTGWLAALLITGGIAALILIFNLIAGLIFGSQSAAEWVALLVNYGRQAVIAANYLSVLTVPVVVIQELRR